MRLAILLAMLTGCGGYIAPEVAPYVQRFDSEVAPVGNVTVEFDTLPAGVAGICYESWLSARVAVDKAEWDALNDGGKEQLVFHELGHCVLGLNHERSLVASSYGSIEASIMAPEVFGDWPHYHAYRDEYVAALKERRSISP